MVPGRPREILVVFDLKGLSSYPDLQSAMILILTDFILGQVESKQHLNRPKQIIMDECWECATNLNRSSLTKRLAE